MGVTGTWGHPQSTPGLPFQPALPVHRARGDLHNEGRDTYGPDVGLREGTLAL